jgi:hypothetical protein
MQEEAEAVDTNPEVTNSDASEHFELLTYDEKVEHLKNELTDKKNILQNTKTEYNLKILLDIWRTYHLEQIEKITVLLKHLDYTKELFLNDLIFINEINTSIQDSNNKDTNLNTSMQQLNHFYTEKITTYTEFSPSLTGKLSKYAKDIAELNKNLPAIAKVFKNVLTEYNLPDNKQHKQFLLECQRLENSLLSTYAELSILKFEQDKTPLMAEYISMLVNKIQFFLTDLKNIPATNRKKIIAKINTFAQLVNTDPTLEAILNLDTKQREIYKKAATCQRLVDYRVNDADYTRIPIMLNLTDFTLNDTAIAAIKLQVSNKPQLNHDKILAMITDNYFKKLPAELSDLERYLLENEILTYVVKNNKRFNDGIDEKYRENLNLPLPELLEHDPENSYHNLMELSILHYTIDSSINSLNDKLIRLSIKITELIKKISLTLIDLNSLSKLVIIEASKLKTLYEHINVLSEETYALEEFLKEHIATIKQHGTNLLVNFEEYKITHLDKSYAIILAELDAIKNTSSRNYRTFANDLSDLLEKYAKFIDKTFTYKEELISLGKEGKLRGEA